MTFMQVQTLLSSKCGTMCHGGMPHMSFQAMAGGTTLHSRLTTPIPAANNRECVGSTLVVPNDAANSLLVKIVKGATTCMNNGSMQNIPRMPNMCGSGATQCLTAAEIKIIEDWVTAGAKAM